MPKDKGTGTIALVMVKDANGSGTPNFGDIVTFTVSTPVTPYPFVTLRVSQNGQLVSQESNRIGEGFDGQFTLGPTPAWSSGAAEAVASLESWDDYAKHGAKGIVQIATLAFPIGA